MGKIIGIDLVLPTLCSDYGWHYCTCAGERRGRSHHAFYHCLYPDGETLAVSRLNVVVVINPQNTLFAIKRLITAASPRTKKFTDVSIMPTKSSQPITAMHGLM